METPGKIRMNMADTGEITPGQAAVRRHYQGMGQSIEAFRLSIANMRTRGVYVYDMRLVEASHKRGNAMCIVKTVSVDGAFIGFASGADGFAALLEAGRLLRVGALTQNNDDYPPKDIGDILAYNSQFVE